MYVGFPRQLEAALPAVSCKVRAALWYRVFSRVCGYGVDVTLAGAHVFRPFIMNGVKRKKLCPTTRSM